MGLQDACLAVVPCLNEARAIRRVVQGLRKQVSQILVVDDGSTDETAALAALAGANLLRHARPLGKGQSLCDGLAWAAERGFDWALLLDGDGQHAPEDAPRFFKAAAGGADLVIGNRMASCSTMPWVRRIANRCSSRLVASLAGRPVPDAQCGYRLVRVAAWQAAGLRATGYEVEAEMIVAFAVAGFRLEFVPIQTIYAGEDSKFHPLADSWRWWRWWWRRRKAGGRA